MGDENGRAEPLLELDVHQSSRATEELIAIGSPLPCREIVSLVWWEWKNLWRLSWAAVIASVFNFTLSLVTQMFVGRLGSLALAGVSIANVGIQGLAYGIMLGMASAVETVSGQAFGAKKYSTMGIVCQRALLIHLATAIILSFLYWFSGSFLRVIHQSSEISTIGQLYSRGLIPQLVAFAIYLPMQKFLQAQNIVDPMAYLAVGTLLFHVLLNWVLISVLELGVVAAALGLSFSWWLLVVSTWVYILYSPRCRQTWTGFSLMAFTGLWSYFKITIASAVMLCLEVWYNQGIVLISGLLSNPEIALDSISICANYLSWDMMIMLGLSNAARSVVYTTVNSYFLKRVSIQEQNGNLTEIRWNIRSVRIANELGASHPRVAKLSVVVVVTTSLIISTLLSTAVLIFRVPLSKLYTSSEEVINAVSSLTPLLAFSILLNGIQPILSGVAIGSGWQATVACVNLAAYYLIGLPIGCVLGFKTILGVAGIWWGLIVGVLVQTVALVTITARTDWNSEVKKAIERLRRAACDDNVV